MSNLQAALRVSFPFNVYLAAVLSALLASLAAFPWCKKWCVRAGLVDEPGHRKIHDQIIPLAGGLTVFTALLIPSVVAALVLMVAAPAGAHFQLLDQGSVFLLRHGLDVRAYRLEGIMVGALGMLILGILDDKHELPPGAKFAGQLAIAFLVAASGIRITLFVPNHIFSYAITILWILVVINAFNFMDNMNGLCAGLGGIGAWYFAIIAAGDGQYLVALIAFLTFGALLGFLPFNFPKAKAFLGDSGSHLVGYLLAVLAILPHFYTVRHPRRWAVLIPLFVLAIPLLDLVWVVVLRWRMGRPFYVGDTNHLSHRLVRLGLTPTLAVLLIWLAATLIGALVYLA